MDVGGASSCDFDELGNSDARPHVVGVVGGRIAIHVREDLRGLSRACDWRARGRSRAYCSRAGHCMPRNGEVDWKAFRNIVQVSFLEKHFNKSSNWLVGVFLEKCGGSI